MKIQVSIDYAIRILQYLHANEEDLPTATTVSQSIGITYPFFIKIAHMLKRNGLVTTVQGRNGGYQLAKPASQISFYDVYLATEGDLQLTRCLREGSNCNRGAESKCRLRGFISGLQEDLISKMSQKSILDLGA